jgi:hypothetical protein
MSNFAHSTATHRPAAVFAALAAVVCLLAGAPSVHAQTDGQTRAAGELLQLMGAESLAVQAALTSLDVQIRGNPAVAPFRDVMEEFFLEVFSWEAIGPEMVAVYAREFSEAELRDMIAFYRTPTGQKLLGKQSDLMQKGAAIGEAQAVAHQAELERRIQARARQLAQRR